ncbi:MAG TPA: glycosyltransferase [Vicinamibacterales bacterium]|nr:glycosyltransferase [Vicinamibacterales bacterium]
MISPHFPPDSSAGTHRVRLLAPHLASYGWTPTVLTVAEQDYEGRVDPELAALVPPSLEVIRTRAMPASVTRRFGMGDLGLRALPGLRRAAWSLHRARPFDALFITIYPTYPAVLGPMFKRHFDVPFILDYQDPWIGAWGSEVGGGNGGAVDAKSRATRALGRRLEPRVLQAADAVTAVSARTYQDAFVRAGISSHVAAEIPIGWDPADLDAIARREPRHRLIPNDGRINICYTGTLLPLGVATLRAVLAAARALIEREPSLADRVRFYFFGTSNQSTGTDARVVPHARELGVEHLVHEQPARLDYLDSLDALRQASAVLLVGSSEPHYTPSKVFPALLAGRPMLAVYRRESTVVEMLKAAAPPPAAHLLTFDESVRVESLVSCIAEALHALVRTAGTEVSINQAALEPWSAHALAGRLAGLCDRIAA